MKLPYKARIMGCLSDGQPIEFARFKRRLAQTEWNFWTNDLSPEWTLWVENTMMEKFCISPRPKIIPPGQQKKKMRLRLSKKENQELEAANTESSLAT